QGLGIDWIDVKKVHMHQGIDQRSAYLLDGDGHGFTPEAGTQLLSPGLQRLRRLVQRGAFPAIAPRLLQGEHVRLIRPIQSYKCGVFNIRIRHQWISPSFLRWPTLPAGSAHNPYSGVLEGHHLSICPASRADRVRKSPPTVDTVGWLIRNPTRPVFPEGNSLQKEKEPKRKKACGNCRNYGNPLKNARLPTVAWISRAKTVLGLSTVTTGPAAVLHMTDISLVKNYKGWLRHQSKVAKPPKSRRRGGRSRDTFHKRIPKHRL